MKKQEEYSWDNVTLVLIGGGEIELDIREDMFDEIWDDLKSNLATNAIWFCANWDEEIMVVSYYKVGLDFIDFKKIIGTRS